jgi:hypothetical protein
MNYRHKALLSLALVNSTGIAQMPSQSPEMDAALKRMMQNVIMLEGTCQRLITPQANQTNVCDKQLVNMVFPSGNSSFMVTIPNGSISFRGRDSAAKGDVATVKVDTILLSVVDSKQMSSIKAKGRCTYTNPNIGPLKVTCLAKTGKGNYELLFLSNGVWPPK